MTEPPNDQDDRPLHVRALDQTSTAEIAALLGRGMADNPVHMAAYRGSEKDRERRHARLMGALLAASPALAVEGVEQGGVLIGVAASAPPGRCRTPSAARLRLLATACSFGVPTAIRLKRWTDAWAAHDPDEPHVHLGPVAVDRHRRGQGVGSLLLLRHTGRLDAIGAVGYLETDRPDAVSFYRRFGYAEVGRSTVLGVPTWRLRRPAA